MRRPSRRAALVATAASALAASPAFGLQKRAVAATDEGAWVRAFDCDVSYYNSCTGWLWAWSGWMPGDRVGVVFDRCNTEVFNSWIRFAQGAPAGYGYTGEIELYEVDEERCPTGDAWDSEPFLPETGWNLPSFYADVPDEFAVVVTLGSASGNPVEFTTDHPAIGPSGPIACGHCYPVDRVTRSFWWGTAANQFCPGSPFFDGFCNAELFLGVTMGPPPLSIEPSSWAAVKSLYR